MNSSHTKLKLVGNDSGKFSIYMKEMLGYLSETISLSLANYFFFLLQYSHSLNKVFIDMNKSLLVQFRVQGYMNGLSIRALPVYSMDDYISTPVQRCDLHILSDDVLHKGEFY